MTTSNIDVLSTLMAARMLISDAESWTRGEFATNQRGAPVLPESHNASCWCSLGAMRAVSCGAYDYGSALTELQHVVGVGVTEFNDTHTHAEVLDAFDATIERLS